MLCISAAIAVMQMHNLKFWSVCPSVTFVSCAKTNKNIFEFFSPSRSQAILVFPCQTNGDILTRTPLTGASNAGVSGNKRDSGRISLHTLHTGLQCCKLYSREVWKIKPRRTASSRAFTAASVVRCSHKTTTKCLWRARRYTPETEVNPPDTTPLVITSFSAAVGQNPAGIFVQNWH